MYGKEYRIGLAALILAFAVYLIINGDWGWSIWVILLAGLVVLTIFRNERIIMAFFHLRKNDFAKAAIAINKIKRPDKLIKSQEAYYYFLQGLVGSQNKDLNVADKAFRKALSIGLRMDHDRAMAKLNIAGIAISKRRKQEATLLLSEAKKLDKSGLLTDQIKLFKDALKRI
jgi:tetratricopeptide (TPR) repeat protein